MKIFLIFYIVTIASCTNDHFAILIAGSKGYENYRHQADTCHAFHTLKNNGIPENQIIHLAYDDIATNPKNPFPGKIFNQASEDFKGWDVYEGCTIDYKGDSANSTNFVAALIGNTDVATGRTLKTNNNSKIFVYYAGLGGSE